MKQKKKNAALYKKNGGFVIKTANQRKKELVHVYFTCFSSRIATIFDGNKDEA